MKTKLIGYLLEKGPEERRKLMRNKYKLIIQSMFQPQLKWCSFSMYLMTPYNMALLCWSFPALHLTFGLGEIGTLLNHVCSLTWNKGSVNVCWTCLVASSLVRGGIWQGRPHVDPQESGLPLTTAADTQCCSVGLCWLVLVAWDEWAGGARPRKATWKGAGGYTERNSLARREERVCKQAPCVTFGTISS